MYRKFVAALVVVVAAVGAVASPVRAADVNNFTISDYRVHMKLGRDGEKRSTLEVTEQITAEFPNYNQNKGLVRFVPNEYDGHTVSFELLSLTRNGQTEPIWDEYTEGGNAVVETGTDDYLLGPQTYEFKYTLRDVTKFYEDTGKTELYWDAIGVDWRVPIQNASITLDIEERLHGEVQTDLQCYAGYSGRNDLACEVGAPIRESLGEYEVTAENLRPKQGVTIALGFAPETFTQYQYTLFERVREIQKAAEIPVAIGMGVLATIVAIVSVSRNRTSRRKLGTIVPEYLPPKNYSVTVAGRMVPGAHQVGPAQLIDFAVRHYIKLREVKPKSFWRKAEYEIEVMKDVSELASEEREILSDMFGHIPAVGVKLELKTLQDNIAYGQRVQDNVQKLQHLVRKTYGLREKDEALQKWWLPAVGMTAVVALLVWSWFPLIGGVFLLVILVASYRTTPKGIELVRYLQGLKLYIKVGEAERLRYLQSPEGAEKVREVVKGVDTPAQRVVLYERVLPYAILFGEEKEWSKQLGDLYDQARKQPSWYSSNTGTWSAASFASSMSSISTSTASAASASTGGSSGGGSSGGGGGGGGGGGR